MGDATDQIRNLGKNANLMVTYTKHGKEQMAVRDLLVSDVLYILKNGFVLEEAEESTQPGLYKYQLQSRSPNSGARTVRLVVIPDPDRIWIKIVTVMWVDGA